MHVLISLLHIMFDMICTYPILIVNTGHIITQLYINRLLCCLINDKSMSHVIVIYSWDIMRARRDAALGLSRINIYMYINISRVCKAMSLPFP